MLSAAPLAFPSTSMSVVDISTLSVRVGEKRSKSGLSVRANRVDEQSKGFTNR